MQKTGLIVSIPENSAAYSDESTTIFDGNGIIVRHSHGEFFERGIFIKKLFFDFLEKRPE